MKKIILAIFVVLGMLGVAHTSAASNTNDKQCKYKLEDARAGLDKFVPAGFVPRGQSADGNRVFGLMLFHNELSKDKDSVDAIALVLIDKKLNKELTFVVAYIGPKKSTVFKRQMGADGKQLSPCFDKTIEDNPKEKTSK